MPKGTVRCSDKSKGYGFITPRKGGRDIFVHRDALGKGPYGCLAPGEDVKYTVECDYDAGKYRVELTSGGKRGSETALIADSVEGPCSKIRHQKHDAK